MRVELALKRLELRLARGHLEFKSLDQEDTPSTAGASFKIDRGPAAQREGKAKKDPSAESGRPRLLRGRQDAVCRQNHDRQQGGEREDHRHDARQQTGCGENEPAPPAHPPAERVRDQEAESSVHEDDLRRHAGVKPCGPHGEGQDVNGEERPAGRLAQPIGGSGSRRDDQVGA